MIWNPNYQILLNYWSAVLFLRKADLQNAEDWRYKANPATAVFHTNPSVGSGSIMASANFRGQSAASRPYQAVWPPHSRATSCMLK